MGIVRNRPEPKCMTQRQNECSESGLLKYSKPENQAERSKQTGPAKQESKCWKATHCTLENLATGRRKGASI